VPFEPDRILALCRPGFEGDAAAELTERTARSDAWGHARTRDGAGLLEFFPADDPLALLAEPAFAERVFPRQLCAVAEAVDGLPPGDRLAPLLDGFATRVSDVVVETADGDAHRPLGRLTRQLAGPVRGALQARGLLVADPGAPRCHVVLDSGSRAWLGLSPPAVSSPVPGGLVRLRQVKDAPSRSALKLEEALTQFLSPTDAHLLFGPRTTAVDLGAAPGGWTFVLRRRGARVLAVDNGPLAPSLEADAEVEHVRADAFTFQPPAMVDWLVCDVVDKPARVVELMARWLRRGWARRALFNLKLPMRRRWAAVVDARTRFERMLGPGADDFSLVVRQLCHDREEVTCLAEPLR
jgi:23S rRNA (cytidine2498-2'-O)-methyltransferase